MIEPILDKVIKERDTYRKALYYACKKYYEDGGAEECPCTESETDKLFENIFCKMCDCDPFKDNIDGKCEREHFLYRARTVEILTDIRDYLVTILDEWHSRIDEPSFYEQNIGVYNHIRKELDDLTEYAKKLGVEL